MKTTIIALIFFGLNTTANATNNQKAANSSALAESPALIEKGKKAYQVNCLMCHGEKADGNGPAGAVMKPKPRNLVNEAFKGVDGKGNIAKPNKDQVYAVIQSGVKGTTMSAYAHLSNEEKWGLAYYILQLRKK